MKSTRPVALIIACISLFAAMISMSQAQRPSRGGGTVAPPPQPIPVPAISPR